MKRLIAAGMVLALASSTAQAAPKVLESHGIVCRYSDGHSVRLTHSRRDSQPVLSPDGHTVAFIHIVKASSEPDIQSFDETDALMAGDCRTGKVRQVLAPTRGKGTMEDIVESFGRPIFSLDGRYVYVSIAPGADYLIIQQINMATGRHRFVAAAELESVIRTGPYRGYILATQHSNIPGEAVGSYYPTYVFRPDGHMMFMLQETQYPKDNDKGVQAWLHNHGWKAW